MRVALTPPGGKALTRTDEGHADPRLASDGVLRRLVPLLAAGLVLSACGETPRPATQPRVTLKLSAPDDGGTTRDERIEIRGTVTPGDASVRVAGQDAEVSGGEFSAEVELLPGGNVIDVAATAPGRRPATDAVRVERDMRVPVPDVVGQESDKAHRDAQGGRAEAGRGARRQLDRPPAAAAPIQVCAMSPQAEDAGREGHARGHPDRARVLVSRVGTRSA